MSHEDPIALRAQFEAESDSQRAREARARMSDSQREREDCPHRPTCQLENDRTVQYQVERLWAALDVRDRDLRRHIDGRFASIEKRIDSAIVTAVNVGRLKNQEVTPKRLPDGSLEFEVKGAKVQGKPWAVAALVLAIVALVSVIGGVAYTLGEWGRPTATTKTL